nr:uncharacterized protein LOC106832885 isoform X5 [Equus asinus]
MRATAGNHPGLSLSEATGPQRGGPSPAASAHGVDLGLEARLTESPGQTPPQRPRFSIPAPAVSTAACAARPGAATLQSGTGRGRPQPHPLPECEWRKPDQDAEYFQHAGRLPHASPVGTLPTDTLILVLGDNSKSHPGSPRQAHSSPSGDPCVGGFNTSGLIDLFKMLDKIYGFYLEKCTWPQGVACRFQRVRTLKPIQSPQVDSPCPLACTPHAGGAENQELPVPGRRKGERAKRQGKEEKEEEQRAPQRVPRQLFPQDCPACSCQAQRPAQLQDQLSVVTLDPTPPLLTPSVLHFLSWVFLVATSSDSSSQYDSPGASLVELAESSICKETIAILNL